MANNDDGDAERRRRKGTTQDKQKVRESERRPRVDWKLESNDQEARISSDPFLLLSVGIEKG